MKCETFNIITSLLLSERNKIFYALTWTFLPDYSKDELHTQKNSAGSRVLVGQLVFQSNKTRFVTRELAYPFWAEAVFHHWAIVLKCTNCLFSRKAKGFKIFCLSFGWASRYAFCGKAKVEEIVHVFWYCGAVVPSLSCVLQQKTDRDRRAIE